MKKKIYIISLIVLIIDQLIKYLITANDLFVKALTIIPNFFYLKYIQNYGAAWGILQNQTFILILVSTITLIFINKYLLNENNYNYISIISYGLLIGGVLGNLLDRVIHGFVIDYLGFYIFNYDFPIFNLADMAIVIGIFLMFIEVVRIEINEINSRKYRKKENRYISK